MGYFSIMNLLAILGEEPANVKHSGLTNGDGCAKGGPLKTRHHQEGARHGHFKEDKGIHQPVFLDQKDV
jgi:hypothetical protein